MKKSKELISLIENDQTFIENSNSIYYNINNSRNNINISKLTLLARNSNSACTDIIDSINKWKLNKEYDLKIFSLLIVLFDANKYTDIIFTLIDLQNYNLLINTKKILINMIIKDIVES